MTAGVDTLVAAVRSALTGAEEPRVAARLWEVEEPRLALLAARLGLDAFDAGVVATALVLTVDAGAIRLAERLVGPGARGSVEPTLMLRLWSGGGWERFTAGGALRALRILVPDAQRGLVLAEPIAAWLLGGPCLDPAVECRVVGVETTRTLAASQELRAEALAACQAERAVAVSGADVETRRAVVAAAAATLQLRLFRMPTSHLPNEPVALDAWVRLWERDAALLSLGLLLEGDAVGPLAEFLDRRRASGGVWFSSDVPLAQLPVRTFHLAQPTATERMVRWAHALELDATEVTALSGQFRVGFDTIGRAAAESRVLPSVQRVPAAWEATRQLTRGRMEDLAERLPVHRGWDSLVLPTRARQTLDDIVTHVRQRYTVDVDWGFAARGRGGGIAALFHGPSGTGKTMAAEVVAHELGLDLYRIDLAAVVSKYIGETEKHLRRVFDAAEAGGAILLFDEADALFGKRSEVSDARDRYANIEVSYLLQRIESYGGLAILTTNMKDALDQAFLRRLRFVVGFAWPDATQRADLWRRAFPAQAPLGDVELGRLAQLDVSGANIANIALHAAFFAAADDGRIGMRHVVRAAREELSRMGRPVPENLAWGRA